MTSYVGERLATAVFAYELLVVLTNALWSAGTQSDESDDIRDQMDFPWRWLTAEENAQIDRLNRVIEERQKEGTSTFTEGFL